MKWHLTLLCLTLNSCAFVDKANEFKGHARIDLLFPLNAIPGLDSVLPHITLDLLGGFEWHNDEQQHQHEMEKIRLQKELEEKPNDWQVRQVFLDTLSGNAGVVQHQPNGERRG